MKWQGSYKRPCSDRGEFGEARALKYREHNREKDPFEIMQIETKDDAQWGYPSVFFGAKKANAVDEEWSQSGGKLIPDENSSKEIPLKSKLERE